MTDAEVSAFQWENDGRNATFGWMLEGERGGAEDGRHYGERTLCHEALCLRLKIRTPCGDQGFFSRHMELTNLSDRPISIDWVGPLYKRFIRPHSGGVRGVPSHAGRPRIAGRGL